MQANRMDDRGTDAMKAHFSECQKLVMRQTRRGCFQEFLGCEVRLLTLKVPQDLFVSVSNPMESSGDSIYLYRVYIQFFVHSFLCF